MATRKQPQSTPQPRIVKPKTSSPHEIYIDSASPVCMMNLDRIKDVVVNFVNDYNQLIAFFANRVC